jgi:hypothetical protein
MPPHDLSIPQLITAVQVTFYTLFDTLTGNPWHCPPYPRCIPPATQAHQNHQVPPACFGYRKPLNPAYTDGHTAIDQRLKDIADSFDLKIRPVQLCAAVAIQPSLFPLHRPIAELIRRPCRVPGVEFAQQGRVAKCSSPDIKRKRHQSRKLILRQVSFHGTGHRLLKHGQIALENLLGLLDGKFLSRDKPTVAPLPRCGHTQWSRVHRPYPDRDKPLCATLQRF